MVVDTSALLALLQLEPEAEQFARVLSAAPARLISAVTRVELSFVAEGQRGERGRQEVDLLLREGEYDVTAVTPHQAEIAIDAFRRFGKGRHRARLNFGDCFAYALAAETGYPLLYKGDDFALTDIPAAI
ncbi:MAG TPA: type II toxin-antitoxin system VapC family toxin [Acetobacteraceae bacterium]|nr:type II toxin-antitoxin system VapC family toxin [Acetobacteraceae bacterium]